MLVLTRKPNENVRIGNDIEVRILEVRGKYVRLGFSAPKELSIHREEVYEKIHANKEVELTVTSDAD